MDTFSLDNKAYWDRRAESFSEGMFEAAHVQRWKAIFSRIIPDDPEQHILDIGTGPGFFAILSAGRGFRTTAIDYSDGMLEMARKNAGPLAEKIDFRKMDAQTLEFEDNTFDWIVTRNLTWNLPDPPRAYAEWYRVLKPGGVLLNFDAGWYEYLFDEEKAAAYQVDRDNVKESGIVDGASYSEAPLMEELSKQLYFSKRHRPAHDMELLLRVGFDKIYLDTSIWKEVWDKRETINYASTLMFMIWAQK